MSGRSVYVQVLPSSEPFHSVARPGIVLKSVAALSVSVGRVMLYASNAATVTPRTGFMLSIPWTMPMVRVSFPPSWPAAVPPPGSTMSAAASTAATKNPRDGFHADPPQGLRAPIIHDRAVYAK